jgi:hypothetical protein
MTSSWTHDTRHHYLIQGIGRGYCIHADAQRLITSGLNPQQSEARSAASMIDFCTAVTNMYCQEFLNLIGHIPLQDYHQHHYKAHCSATGLAVTVLAHAPDSQRQPASVFRAATDMVLALHCFLVLTADHQDCIWTLVFLQTRARKKGREIRDLQNHCFYLSTN